jgi:uncharacterized protein (DUF58 family)
MERHSLRALLSIGLLVVLAWAGIALFAKLHGHVGLSPWVVVWAVAVIVVMGAAIWSIAEARRARLERRPEATRGRK